MSKVITFSRVFPAYHPKAGQPTYFVEKIWQSFGINPLFPSPSLSIHNTHLSYDIVHLVGDDLVYLHEYEPKHHTIRSGNRWKVGDKFSPRVWSGKPYSSKQIIIAPDIEIKKIWDFEIIQATEFECDWYINGKPIFSDTFHKLAQNDGLLIKDMSDWFIPDISKVKSRIIFKGQIICWNENIEY